MKQIQWRSRTFLWVLLLSGILKDFPSMMFSPIYEVRFLDMQHLKTFSSSCYMLRFVSETTLEPRKKNYKFATFVDEALLVVLRYFYGLIDTAAIIAYSSINWITLIYLRVIAMVWHFLNFLHFLLPNCLWEKKWRI